MTFNEYTPRWKSAAYRMHVLSEAQRLHSDGCTGVPDFYVMGCYEHDIAYRTGMDLWIQQTITHAEADRNLRYYIQYRSPWGKLSPMAWWRWAALRIINIIKDTWNGTINAK